MEKSRLSHDIVRKRWLFINQQVYLKKLLKHYYDISIIGNQKVSILSFWNPQYYCVSEGQNRGVKSSVICLLQSTIRIIRKRNKGKRLIDYRKSISLLLCVFRIVSLMLPICCHKTFQIAKKWVFMRLSGLGVIIPTPPLQAAWW